MEAIGPAHTESWKFVWSIRSKLHALHQQQIYENMHILDHSTLQNPSFMVNTNAFIIALFTQTPVLHQHTNSIAAVCCNRTNSIPAVATVIPNV